MSLSQLLNATITIVHRAAGTTPDVFGNITPTETLTDTVGDLQQTQRREGDMTGETSDTTWTLFLLAGTVIDTGDAVICNGRRYELIGAPWEARNPRTRTVSHIEATVRRVSSANDEGTP